MKQQKKQAGITVFYSYAHEDESLREQLEKRLSMLRRQGLISEWHDRQIAAGTEWAKEIDAHLETASVILLLVSSDFLASDYCYDIEMQRALERHARGEARVIPIILRPCEWQQAPFAHLQALPHNGKSAAEWNNLDAAFLDITQGIRKALEQRISLPQLSDVQRQNRTQLLKRVQAIWIEGLLEQSLHQAAWMDLHLREQPDALENPWRFQVQELDQAPRDLPADTSIVQVYDEADGELLILGEPGSGKTTLLLQLARTLLDRAEADESLLMPVVFNLSSWAQKQEPLVLWLVEELKTKYQVPRQVGQHWIEAKQVLPLLDGLDEVASTARDACVQAIIAYHDEQSQAGTPVVICCRSEEYQALSLRLPLQRAVRILPLTQEQIDEYLSTAENQLEELRQALRDDRELCELACRPLMLSIFTLAYQGGNAVGLPTVSTQEQTLHAVFESYVKRMLTRRGTLQQWTQEQFLSWLRYFARQLDLRQQTLFSVESLQPNWLPGKQQHLYWWGLILSTVLFFGPVNGLLFALAGGLGGKLFDGPVGKHFHGPGGGLLIGLLIGLLMGLIFAFTLLPQRSHLMIRPGERFHWSWQVAQSALRASLGGMLPLWILWEAIILAGTRQLFGLGPLSEWLISGLGLFAEWPISLGFILLVALVSGLLFGLVGATMTERAHFSPNEGIWRSGKNGLVIGLLVGTLAGLATGRFSGLPGGLLAAQSVGLLVGLHLGLETFTLHFILRLFLWRLNYLPWNVVAFLNEAAERLLLRKMGGSYIFMHRLLLEYFASLDEPISIERTSAEEKI